MDSSRFSHQPKTGFGLNTLLRSFLRPLHWQSKWALFASPVRHDALKPRSQSHRVRPIVLRSHDGTRLSGWLMTPRWPEAKGAVLYFGNGSEEALWLAGQAQVLFPEMTILVMRYRDPAGRAPHPAVEDMVADGEMLYDWLADSHQHLPCFPVIIMGRGVGAGVAVQVAASRPAAALTLFTPCDAGAAERSGRFGLLRRSAAAAREPAFVFKQSNPVLVLRAQTDSIVHPAEIDAFVARLPVRTQDQTISGADHHDLPYREEAHAMITAFLREHVPARPTGLQRDATVAEPSLVLAA